MMRKWLLPLLAASLSVACKKAEQAKAVMDDARRGDTAAVGYVKALQDDVDKAQAAADKARAAIQASQGGDAAKPADAGQ